MLETSEAIISIHPIFAEEILRKRKTVELRRRIPATKIGTRLWIYATRPVSSIIGIAKVSNIVRSDPADIWSLYSAVIGINRSEFDRYFDGSKEAVAIHLSEVRRLRPINMEMLRAWREGFHPPQVLMRVSAQEGLRLLSMGCFGDDNAGDPISS